MLNLYFMHSSIVLGNRGGLAPIIYMYLSIRNASLLLKAPKCCVSGTLEGSRCYRDGSCAICTLIFMWVTQVMKFQSCSNFNY